MSAPVDRLLRVAFLTAANFGAAAGEASLDRPTQKAEGSGLPYVPDSALKGVLAGEHGDVGEEASANSEREPLYGSPDREEAQGAASRIVFGNAELLCFPLGTEDGGAAHVVPAASLGRFLWLEGIAERFPEAVALLSVLEHHSATARPAVALPVWPRLARSFEIAPLAARIEPRGLAELTALLTRYTGWNPTVEEPLVVVPARLAARLWVHAAEVRAATALLRTRRVVREATLRTLELIPERCVFLSLVTWIDSDLQAPLASQAQLGSGEGIGLGCAELSWVRPLEAPVPGEIERASAPPRVRFDEAASMIVLHGAVQKLADDPTLWKKVASAGANLGGRIQFSGLEAALAFELAKAKPAHEEPSSEARAHRWLLAHVLGLSPETGLKERADTLQMHLTQGFQAPGTFEREREAILIRWLWLRRFLELPPETVEDTEKAETP